MIIPFVFTLDPVYENLSQTWVFYKAVSFCKKYGWPIIAQTQYFDEWEKQHRIFPQFFRQDLCDMFEYDVPAKQDLLQIQQVPVPKEIEKRYIAQKGTQSDAYMASFREDWTELEDFLCDRIQQITEDKGEKVEAITSLTYLKFLDNVSKRTGIPVIYYEWGPFRYSSYRNTAYFDINKEYWNVHSMYEDFLKEDGVHNLPVLQKKEILALFLQGEDRKYIEKRPELSQDYNKYELGIIGGYNSLVETSAYTYLNMVELYNSACQQFDENEIAVRYHPGDPIHARLNVKNEEKGGLIDFLLSCKRVACISSNVEVEAMLYDKKVYDIGAFKYQGIVNGSLSQLEDQEASLEEINFIVFVTIIPYELLNSVEYIRFRLSDPKIQEVYLYHLKYYLECAGISYESFAQDKENWMQMITDRWNVKWNEEDDTWKLPEGANERQLYVLVQRYRDKQKNTTLLLREYESHREELERELEGRKINEEDLERQLRETEERAETAEKQNCNLLETHQSELEQLRNEKEQLAAELKKMQTKFDTVMNSKSMKLTKPFRDILGRRS